MAKMFYSLEEAAERLDKSPDEVRDMASKGQLQEFRDRDKLMFKREQVDLLAGGEEGGDVIPLAESGELEPLSLASSGTGMSLDAPKESTGIDIFETDDTDDSDPSAVTRITTAPGSLVDPGDKSASGSGGLLDLTKEADDTSLGANLLDDVYGGDTVSQATTASDTGFGGDAGGLFESPGGTTETAPGVTMAGAGGTMLVAAEPFDGAGSGLVGGLAFGMVIAALLAAFAIIISFTSTAGSSLVEMLGSQYMILIGAVAGLTLIAGILGLVIGKKS